MTRGYRFVLCGIAALLLALAVGISAGQGQEVQELQVKTASHGNGEILKEFQLHRRAFPSVRLGIFTIPVLPSDFTSAPGESESGTSILLRSIKVHVHPGSWERPGSQLAVRHGKLVVYSDQEVIEALGRYLKTIEKEVSGRGLVRSEMRIVELDEKKAAGIWLLDPAKPGEAEKGQPRVLTEKEYGFLLRENGARVLSAPHLTSFSGQKANISVYTQHAYTADYVSYFLDGRKVVDPVKEVLTEGICVDICAELSRDKRTVTCRISMTMTQLHRMDQVKTENGFLSCPVVTRRETNGRWTGALPSMVLIAGPPHEGKRTLLLVRCSLVAFDDESSPRKGKGG